MTPQQHYLALIAAGQLQPDPVQQQAMTALQTLFEQLQAPAPFLRQRPSLKGIYLWGPVGRGKTLLMDLFARSLPDTLVRRQHFHHFMADVHAQLRTLAGRPDPLAGIADTLAKRIRLLCFDEFFVSDIGDAMLLGRLLQRLFEKGVTLVATSNTPPDRLYWNGLQRERFQPAIVAIKTHTSVIALQGERDYRTTFDLPAGRYIVEPADDIERVTLRKKILENAGLCGHNSSLAGKSLPCAKTPKLSGDSTDGSPQNSITILGRNIVCVARCERVIAFEFAELCEGARSHFDYIEIARDFDHVILLGVPCLSGLTSERIKARGTEDGAVGSGDTGERHVRLAPRDDAARRLIALIDELYDQRCLLTLTSSVSLDTLYQEGSLLFEFQRAHSRLLEMGSPQYAARQQRA